jgi:small-conductance mechanosensitive channel
MSQISALLKDIARPDVWLEIATLLACLGLAYALVHWQRPKTVGTAVVKESVWFGRRTLDGVLFPLVALVLLYAAKLVWFEGAEYAIIRLAAPIIFALTTIRLIARVLSAAYPDSAMARLLERFFSWLVWLGVVLWLLGALPVLTAELESMKFSFGKSKVSLLTILEGIVSAGLVLVISLWVSATIEAKVLRDAVADLSLRKIATNAIRMVLLIVGLLFALSALGVDLTALSVLGGAFGVGLGLGMQKLAANYVSGFVILLERSLRIGDNVKVDGFEGKVSDIKTRYTVIRAVNGREAIVPNEKLITERVENLSLADPKILIMSHVTVGYDSDVALVQKLLCDAAVQSPRVLKDPEPVAHLANFLADGLEFVLCFWIADPENGQLNVRGDINVVVLHALRKAGIEIPYPQRVVQMRAEPATALGQSATANASLQK